MEACGFFSWGLSSCGDCVSSFDRMKGMCRTFIGHKATNESATKTALVLTCLFLSEKDPFHVFLTFAVVAIMGLKRRGF